MRNVIPRFSPSNSTASINGSTIRLDPHSIRTELPGAARNPNASWQSLNSNHGQSSRSLANLTNFGDNPFAASYRSDLGRNTSLDSSVMAAQDIDETNRDFMMKSSSPVTYDASLPHEGATNLIEDMVQCQLESGVDFENAVRAVETSAVAAEGYDGLPSSSHLDGNLRTMFAPYSTR